MDFEYGDLLDGEEIMADRMPGSIVSARPDPSAIHKAIVETTISTLIARLSQASELVMMAAEQGACRCGFYPDPKCVVCRARELLKQWNAETQPPGNPIPQVD